MNIMKKLVIGALVLSLLLGGMSFSAGATQEAATWTYLPNSYIAPYEVIAAARMEPTSYEAKIETTFNPRPYELINDYTPFVIISTRLRDLNGNYSAIPDEYDENNVYRQETIDPSEISGALSAFTFVNLDEYVSSNYTIIHILGTINLGLPQGNE